MRHQFPSIPSSLLSMQVFGCSTRNLKGSPNQDTSSTVSEIPLCPVLPRGAAKIRKFPILFPVPIIISKCQDHLSTLFPGQVAPWIYLKNANHINGIRPFQLNRSQGPCSAQLEASVVFAAQQEKYVSKRPFILRTSGNNKDPCVLRTIQISL